MHYNLSIVLCHALYAQHLSYCVVASVSYCVNNDRNREDSEQPSDEGPVEPVAVLLASVREILLRLVGQESLLLAVDLVLAGVEVSFVWLDAFGLHDELVAEDANEVDGNTLRIMLAGHTNVGAIQNLRGNQ